MFFAALEYLMVFAVSSLFIGIYQKIYNNTYLTTPFSRERSRINYSAFCLLGCLSIFPIIAMFGLRYGIGTDYFSYESIYNTIHSAGIIDYFTNHSMNKGWYYVEPGYYALNHLFPSYRVLLWGCGILIYSLLFWVMRDYSKDMSFAFALFIYLSTQFTYSLNGMRFSIAICFVLAAYNALIKTKNKLFIVFVLLATSFHKTALICLAFFFLKEYPYKSANCTRNCLLVVSITLFPVIIGPLFEIMSMIPLFERYFAAKLYVPSASMDSRWTWIMHIAPVIIPLLILARKEIFAQVNTSILFRIYIMEIPFRMFSLYNGWYARLARYADIVLVLMLPLVIAKIKKKQKRILLYLYYVAWFIFYYTYYAIIGDQAGTLPYKSILFR